MSLQDLITVDPAAVTSPPPDGADILAEMRRFIEAHTVHIFCHPDELERIAAAADELSAKIAAEGTPPAPHKVYPSPIVPAGTIHVLRGDWLHQTLTGKPAGRL